MAFSNSNIPGERGYSLVAVLAALIILMVVLIPLLSLQGKIYQSALSQAEDEALRIIERDLDTLPGMGVVRSKRLDHPDLQIERQTLSKEKNLTKLRYEVKRQDGRLLFVVYRYHYIH